MQLWCHTNSWCQICQYLFAGLSRWHFMGARSHTLGTMFCWPKRKANIDKRHAGRNISMVLLQFKCPCPPIVFHYYYSCTPVAALAAVVMLAQSGDCMLMKLYSLIYGYFAIFSGALRHWTTLWTRDVLVSATIALHRGCPWHPPTITKTVSVPFVLIPPQHFRAHNQ